MSTTTPDARREQPEQVGDGWWRPRTGEDLIPILQPVMRAIATAVGPHCEVVLHDLSKGPEHTIVAIENGQLTGRTVGGSSTNLGLEVIHTHAENLEDLGYRSATPDGRELRSSSVYYRNAAGDVIAALCINFDLTVYQSVKGLMDDMLQFSGTAGHEEIFAANIDEVLDQMIDDALVQIRRPVAEMNKSDRLRVVGLLEDRGAFVVKSAVETVASRLKISRVTVYSYLDDIRSGR